MSKCRPTSNGCTCWLHVYSALGGVSEHAALQVPWLGRGVAGGGVLAGGGGRTGADGVGAGGLSDGDFGGGGLGMGPSVPPVIRYWLALH